jgi:peptide/nickel transport system substrate-binding protein
MASTTISGFGMAFRLTSVALVSVWSAIATPASHAEGVLTVAMTAGDLPIDAGIADQGFEGTRFVTYNLYDSLTGWDMSRSDVASGLVPVLATSVEIDPSNNRRWVLKLRQGVSFHDGCKFTADDVV